MSDQDVIEQYASLKSIIADCEDKLELIKADVITALKSSDCIPMTEHGSFKFQNRLTYEYTPETMELERQVKATKKEEEMTGVATIKGETEILVFTATKK